MRRAAALPLAALALILYTQPRAAMAQELAQTPPMGWNSWNYLRRESTTRVSEPPRIKLSPPA